MDYVSMFANILKKITKILSLPFVLIEVYSGRSDYSNYNLFYKVNKLLKRFALKNIFKSRSFLKTSPKISVIVPVYNTSRIGLTACIDSVINQNYENWELCIADDASTQPYIKEILNSYIDLDSRIKVVFRKENGHISKSSNSALSLCTGDYICLLDHDDLLEYDALLEVAKAINIDPSVDYLYTDEDKILEDRNYYCEPAYKPGWSIDKLFGFMYTGHLSVYRKIIIDRAGGFRVGYEGAQDYDLLLRSLKHIKKVCHIQKVLYHWRKTSGSSAEDINSKKYGIDAGQKSLKENLSSYTSSQLNVNYKGLGCYSVQCDIPSNIKIDILYKSTISKNSLIISQLDECLGSKCHNIQSYRNIEQLSKLFYSSSSDYLIIINDNCVISEQSGFLKAIGYLGMKNVGFVGPKIINNAKLVRSSGLVFANGKITTPLSNCDYSSNYNNILNSISNCLGLDSLFIIVNRSLVAQKDIQIDSKSSVFFALDLSVEASNKSIRTVMFPDFELQYNNDIDYNSKEHRLSAEYICSKHSNIVDSFGRYSNININYIEKNMRINPYPEESKYFISDNSDF
ncbi:glycosyltransferase [Candidatus Dojkabacteria bacterium]|nr:glycosyltransferase [Candidatus Dojkabacteria bacterium]